MNWVSKITTKEPLPQGKAYFSGCRGNVERSPSNRKRNTNRVWEGNRGLPQCGYGRRRDHLMNSSRGKRTQLLFNLSFSIYIVIIDRLFYPFTRPCLYSANNGFFNVKEGASQSIMSCTMAENISQHSRERTRPGSYPPGPRHNARHPPHKTFF